MAQDAGKILSEALGLPQEARAALAASLIESLDEEVDENAEAAWQAEVSHRLEEIRSGSVTLVPWTEARRRILGK